MFKKKLKTRMAVFLIGAMILGTSGCGKSDPDEYKYGQSVDQIDSGNVYVASTEDSGTTAEGSTEDTTGEGTTEEKTTESASAGANEYADTKNQEFEDFVLDLFKEDVTSSTFDYHDKVVDGSHYGIERPSPATYGDADASYEAIEEDLKELDELEAKLKKFDGAPLTREEYITYRIIQDDIELSRTGNKYADFSEVFAPNRGFQSNIGTSFAEYKFYDKQDVIDYIELINQLPAYIDVLCEWENNRAAKGFALQDANADEVIEQCETFNADKENHFLIQEFNNKVDEADFLTADEKTEFKKQNVEAMNNSMFPAMDKIKDCVAANKGKASATGGVCNYADGKAYYEDYIIPYYSGCKLSGDEVIDLYEKKYDELIAQMTSIYFADVDTYNYFIENEDKLFADADKMEIGDIIKSIMDTAMDDYPDIGEIKFKALYLSKALESIMDNTLAYYMSPAIDDPDNNIIRVNGSHNSGLWTTLAHEGCPGHMFQNSYLLSLNVNPYMTSHYCLGYLEGWAVYSSYNVISKYDFPDTDKDELVAELYRLNEVLQYYLMGRLDLGINYQGWTVEDVKTYMNDKGFNGEAAADVYNVFVGDPGLYLSYTLSYYLMQGERDRAEEALGSKFDPVEFHKAVLSTGPVMFDVLDERIDEYIKENK